MTKKKKNTTPKIATKQQTEYLKCVLTAEEVAVAANDLAKLLDDTQALEDQLASVKADFKAKIEKCEADTRVKQRLVRDKCDYRQVECDVEYNYSTLMVKITRKDTNEVIEDRKMTLGEKQMTMDFDEDGKEQAAA